MLRDPFDRLIAGTAVALGLPLMTPDARIARAGRVPGDLVAAAPSLWGEEEKGHVG